MDNIVFVPIEKIAVNEYQPEEFVDPEQVREIAESLKRYRGNGQKGLLQIPLARQVNGHYEEAFGRHRLLAFQLLAREDPFWNEMPLLVKDLTDQEMFELMGAENFKRRNISVIEKARIFQAHMAKFGATSPETAAVFGVTEEAVRGTVRLLNLPPTAQEAMQSGKINVSAGRALLSAQKIAPEKDMLEIVQKLEKGVDRWGEQTAPEKIVVYALKKLDEVVEMWDDDRGDKPRAAMDYRNESWLLSMKNFPNKLLPQLTPVDAAIALGIQDDPGALATLGTWINEEIESRGHDVKTADYTFLDGRLTVDQIERLKHLLNPPACSACPFYAKINGSHFCGINTCHTRKMDAWHLNQIQAASRDLKIELYQDSDGKYKLLDTYDKGDAALFKKRHKDLRLIEREKVRGYHYQHFDGCNDNVCFVVVVGKTRENLESARKEARAEEKQQASTAQRAEELYSEGRKRLEWEATLSIKTLFEGLNLQALKALEEAGFDWSADGDDVPEGEWVLEDAPEDAQAEWQRRIVALSMLHEAPGRFDARASTSEAYATWIVETAKGWGVKMHKSVMGIAKRLDEEIRAVTTETAE